MRPGFLLRSIISPSILGRQLRLALTSTSTSTSATVSKGFLTLTTTFVGAVWEKWYGKLMLSIWGTFLTTVCFLKKRKGKGAIGGTASKRGDSKEKSPGKRRIDHLSALLRVVAPKLFSKHGAFLVLYIVTLVSRIFVTVQIADLGGYLGAWFGSRQWKRMFQGQARFGMCKWHHWAWVAPWSQSHHIRPKTKGAWWRQARRPS